MESLLYLLAAGKIHSIRLLQDISCHARGIPLHKLQGIAKAEQLWCCEQDPVVYPLAQLLAWLGFYHRLTYQRLRTFEARGIVRRRKPNRGYNSCEAYVLTRKGQRYMRLHSHRYGYTSRAVDNGPGPMEPLMA